MRSETPSGGGRSPVATKRHKAQERLLVVDASLTPKLATRLKERGREAVSANELGWKDYLDPDLLRAVFGRYPNAVLVTGDDKMPQEHPVVIAEVKATIATIEPWDRVARTPHRVTPDGLSDEEIWKREVVQRWAHKMATQDSESVRRYSRERGAPWTARVRSPQGRLFKS